MPTRPCTCPTSARPSGRFQLVTQVAGPNGPRAERAAGCWCRRSVPIIRRSRRPCGTTTILPIEQPPPVGTSQAEPKPGSFPALPPGAGRRIARNDQVEIAADAPRCRRNLPSDRPNRRPAPRGHLGTTARAPAPTCRLNSRTPRPRPAGKLRRAERTHAILRMAELPCQAMPRLNVSSASSSVSHVRPLRVGCRVRYPTSRNIVDRVPQLAGRLSSGM